MKYVVIDANSSHFDENLMEFDYSRGIVVEADNQASACTRAELRGSKLWADKQLPSGVKRQDVCVWMQDSDGTWCTSCGVTWEFIDGMPADNKAHFCHHCGGVLLGDGFEEVSASGPKES